MDTTPAQIEAPARAGARLVSPRPVPPVPTPPAEDLPLFAYLKAIRTDAVSGWPARAYEDLVTERRLMGRTSFTVSDPEAIRHVLIDNPGNYARTPASVRILRPMLGDGLLISDGAPWRHQRRTLAPAFTPRATDELVPHIAAAVEGALAEIEAAARSGPVDLFPLLHRMALEIAGRSMFSVGMERHGEELRALMESYATRLGRPHLLDMLLPLRVPAPLDLPRALFRRRWVRFLDRIVAARAAEPAPRAARDLLDLMGAARDPETGEGFPPGQLRDQVATMLLAGHETTAVALLWACTLLARDPESQERAAAEARAAGAEGDPGGALASRLPFTRAVVDETLRLYPPAFAIVRAARGPDAIAGRKVAAGDVLLMPPWVIHRHKKLWRDPGAFDPGRFLPGAEPVARTAYLPFGAGPRVCIGASFALAEAVLALAGLLARFRIAMPDGAAPMPAAVVTTQPDRAPLFRLTLRTG